MSDKQLWPDAYIPREDAEAVVAEWKQRAEAAERELDDLHVMLSCLPEYMRYCNDIEGPTLTLAEWWSAQPDEVQP